MQTMDHHKEGTVVFYEGKCRNSWLIRLRHDHDEAPENAPKSEQIIQITRSDAWSPELSAKVDAFFKDMLSRYAKGELSKEQVGQKKVAFMAETAMPTRRGAKAQPSKGITARPAASDTAVAAATKPTVSDTVLSQAANKRQKVTASAEVAGNLLTGNTLREGCIAAQPAANVALFKPNVPPPPQVFPDTI